MEQLLLFQESKEEKMMREIENLKAQTERVRKSQFAKIGELSKLYQETKHEIETLKAAMCRGKTSQIPLQSTIPYQSDLYVA